MAVLGVSHAGDFPLTFIISPLSKPTVTKLLLLLTASGVASVFERLILALTQQRQSPQNASVYGVSNLIFDGLKLFSKISTEVSGSTVSLIFVSVIISSAVCSDTAYGKGNLIFPSIGAIMFFIFCAEVLEFGVFFFGVWSRNHFVDMALSRLAVITGILGVTLELIVLGNVVLGYFSTSFVSSTAFSLANFIFVFAISAFLVLLRVGKAPFDVVEAESELIDGVSSDISGAIFSTFYSGEVIELFVITKFLMGSGVGLGLFQLFCVIVTLIFVGRIFLARFLVTEMIVWSLTTGLIVGPA